MLRQRDGGKEEISVGGQHLATEQWSLKNVGRAVAAASRPEVWALLDTLKAPWKFKSFVRQALWKKLAVNSRLQQNGIRDTDQCPLCQNMEDHEHRFN